MIFLALALAGDEGYDTFDPLAYKPGRPNIVDTPLDEVLDYTEVAFEGHIVEARKEIWMGPAGNIGMMVLRVAVDQELYGHVESGLIDVAVDDFMPPPLTPGLRVMFLAGYKTHQLHATSDAEFIYPDYLPYDDLFVPAVPGALYFQYSIDGTVSSTRFQSSPTARVSWAEGPDGSMLSWEEGIAALRVAIQATGRSGSTVAGVQP